MKFPRFSAPLTVWIIFLFLVYICQKDEKKREEKKTLWYLLLECAPPPEVPVYGFLVWHVNVFLWVCRTILSYHIITQALTVVSCAIRFIELKIILHIMYMVNYLQCLGRLCSNRRITAIVEIIRPWARNRGVLYICP